VEWPSWRVKREMHSSHWGHSPELIKSQKFPPMKRQMLMYTRHLTIEQIRGGFHPLTDKVTLNDILNK
jgi:hypothetical protein